MAQASSTAWTLVTGANRGIGLQLVRELLAEQRAVILVARGLDKAQSARTQLLDELKKENKPAAAVHSLSCDMGSPADVNRLAEEVQAFLKQDQGRLAALVNNAGMMTDKWEKDNFERHMEVNARAPIRLATLLRDQLAQDGGQVVSVSSGLGSLKFTPKSYLPTLADGEDLDKVLHLPFMEKPGDTEKEGTEPPGMLSYKLSKAALNRATRLLSQDEAWAKVPINVVCPGWVRTDMGTDKASRTPTEGVASIRAILDKAPPLPTGTFTRDGREMDWVKGSDDWN